MTDIYRGATHKFETNIDAGVAISAIDGIRIKLVHEHSLIVLKEWRYPADPDYGEIVIVDDINGDVKHMLEAEDTVDAPTGFYDLETWIKDDDADFDDGYYRDIGFSKSLIRLVPVTVGA